MKMSKPLLLLAGTSLAIAASFLSTDISSRNASGTSGSEETRSEDAMPSVAEPRECDLHKGIDKACVFH